MRGPVALDLAVLVRPMSIIGRMRGVRQLPFNHRLVGFSTAARAYWRRPGSAIPVTDAGFNSPADLDRKTVGAILIAPNEALESANPMVERQLIADLSAAVASAMDAAFVDATNAGSDSTPAAITRAGTIAASTGTTVAAIDSDLAGMVSALLAGGSTLQSAAWVLHPRTAFYLSRLRGSDGGPIHPRITALGGDLFGLPVLVSAGVPLVGANTQIALIDGDGIALGDEDEGRIELAVSGSIEMNSDPTGNINAPSAPSTVVSMFQTESTAIKIVRSMNWLPRRPIVAATLTAVAY